MTKLAQILVIVALASSSLQAQAACPEISTGWLKTLLDGKPMEEQGYVYVPEKTEQSKFRKFFTLHKNYQPGPKLQFIEPFSSDEKGEGKRTCAYRYQSGPMKQDAMLILNGTPKTK